MVAPIKMTKAQMREGFLQGRTLIQEEWSNPEEIHWLDELIIEGVCSVTAPWEYKDNFQCKRRRVTGIKSLENENNP